MNQSTGSSGTVRLAEETASTPVKSLISAFLELQPFWLGCNVWIRSVRIGLCGMVLIGGCGNELNHPSAVSNSGSATPPTAVRPGRYAVDVSEAGHSSRVLSGALTHLDAGCGAEPKPARDENPVDAIPRLEMSRSARQLTLSPGRRSVTGSSAMVVSVSADATRIGLQILKSGGNAVDAAVAIALALAVTHPSAGNLGGGGFAMLRLRDNEVYALDFRESSPARLERPRFSAMIRAGGEGPDSVGIPGTVAGLFELSARFGRLQFSQLVEPARHLAEAGHTVSQREAAAIATAWPKLKRNPLARKLYGRTAQNPLGSGAKLKLPGLAATFARLQEEGSKAFYSGPIASSIIASLGSDPQIRADDLLGYRAIWRQPLEVPYRGVNVAIMPPPSAGGVALATSLLLLGAYDPATLRRGSTAHAHLLLEIMRRAQADRIYGVVDPDSVSPERRTLDLVALLDPDRWLKRQPIDPNHATANLQLIDAQYASNELEHTTHLAVVDQQGMAVSLTTTLSSGFGSKVLTESGIFLNNSLASFSGKGQNQPLPNRRTTSSMAPTLVADASGLRLVLGTPGGDTIPSTLLQLVNSLVDYSVPLDAAIDAPRLHQSIAPKGLARMESGRPIDPTLERSLARLGHRFARPTTAMGHANSIAIINGQFYGYVDPREGGLALGLTVE